MLWLNHCIAFSPDGRTLVSAMDDSTIRVVDASNGNERAVLKGHTSPASICVFSPNGRILVSAGGDDTVRLWDIFKGEEQLVQIDLKSPARVCAFSPAGCTLVTSGKDDLVRLWDIYSGHELLALNRRIKPGNSIYSPNGCILAMQRDDQTLLLWDVSAVKPIKVFPCIGRIVSYIFNSLGDRLAMVDVGGNFYLLELMGFRMKAIMITAAERSHGLIVPCPSCQQQIPIIKDQLGTEMTCPTEGCGLHWKINPFVINMA
jgi:WD40 repeat protein